MTNKKAKIGKRTTAARRMAAMLITGTLAGTLAAGVPGVVQVAHAGWSENADYIFERLTQKYGYNEAAACGIMANIRCESTFNPHAWNAGGGSYGLCQWTGGRYGRLQSWCRSNGYDYTTIDGQLAYLEYELTTHYTGVENYIRSVENTSDGAYDAGQYYCYHFEAPASRGSVSVYRGGLASGTFWESYRPAEWYQVDGIWHYIKNDGTYHTSWLTIDNKTYYLDEDGNRVSGWKTIDGKRYYFDQDGVMATGWITIDGKDYYLDEDGALVTGLVVGVNKDWYMLDETGKILASAEMKDFAKSWIASNPVSAPVEKEIAVAEAEKKDEPENTSSEGTAQASENTVTAVSEANKTLKKQLTKDPGKSKTSILGMGLAGSAQNNNASSDSELSLLHKDEEHTKELAAEAAEATDPAETSDAIETAETAETVEAAAETTAAAETAQAAAEATEEAAETAEASETAQAAETAEDTAAETAEAAGTSEPAEETDDAADESVADDEETADTADSAAEDSAEADTEETDAAEADTEEAAAEEAEEDADTAEATEEEAEDTQDAGTADDADEAQESEAQEEEASSGKTSGSVFSEEALAARTFEKVLEQEKETSSDEFLAADALRRAAQASDEEADEEDSSDGLFVIYEPENADADKTAQARDDVNKKVREDKEEESPIKITLKDENIFITSYELDNIVEVLDEMDFLKAVTEDGKEITDQVEAEVERVNPNGNAYTVTFTVDYDGETAELETEVYVK